MTVGLWAGSAAHAPAPPTASSVSLRWRVMLLAMSMVAMVVVLMAVAVYAVVARALYDDIDTQLLSRANLLSESGLLENDPSKAIESTAYSEVNAMLFTPQASTPPTMKGRRCPSVDPSATSSRAGCGCHCAPSATSAYWQCISTTATPC